MTKLLTFALCLLPSAFLAQSSPQLDEAIRNLRSPDAKARGLAVQHLNDAAAASAAEYVAPLIMDPNDTVQFAAIDAELTFFLVESIAGRKDLRGARSRAQEAFDAGPVVRMAAPAPLIVIDELLAATRDKNPRIRFDAMHVFGVIAEAPLPPAQQTALLQCLDHPDPVVRAVAARVVGRLRIAEAGDKLIAGLNDPNELVRRYSAEALGWIREVRAVQSLTELTTYYGRDVTGRETLLALARIAHPSSAPLFRSWLRAADPAIRLAAAEGLGRLRDRELLETLRSMMVSDANSGARLAAAYAVGQMAEPQAHVIAAGLRSPETAVQARNYLLELGSAAIPGVQSAITVTSDPRGRADLIHVLGFIGTRDTVGVVEPFLKDRDERVSRAAANAINRLRAK